MNGPFGNGYPYVNFHEMNLDWVIQIAKDFLDQYSNIQNTITQGLEDLDTKAAELQALLDEWYNEHSQDIADQLASALEDLNTWYTQHQDYLDQTLQDNITAFGVAADAKAAETIASIPDDYTELSNKVTAAENAITDILDYQNVSDYAGTVSGTQRVITSVSIPAGTYIFHADSITSTDTDNTVCRVMFVHNEIPIADFFADRTTNYNKSVTIAEEADELYLFASDGYSTGAGDTFSFTGIRIFENSELNKRFTTIEKDISDILKYQKITVFDQTVSGTRYVDVPADIPAGTYVFSAKQIESNDTDNTMCRIMFLRQDLTSVTQIFVPRTINYSVVVTFADKVELIRFFASDGTATSTGDTFTFTDATVAIQSELNNRITELERNGEIIIPTNQTNLIQNIKNYNGTKVTLLLDNGVYDIVDIYKTYYGDDYFTNYTGWQGNPDPFSRGLYTTGIKIKGRANTKFIFPSDTGNNDVRTHFSIFAPYTDTTLENLTIDIGNGFCRYAIHDDYAPQNCTMLYKNLVLMGSSGSANALYGNGCGSNVTYILENCWLLSGTDGAVVAHSAPNQTAPCIFKFTGCVTHQQMRFYYYSTFSGMNKAYVDANITDIICIPVQAGDTMNMTVYHDTGTEIEILPED